MADGRRVLSLPRRLAVGVAGAAITVASVLGACGDDDLPPPDFYCQPPRVDGGPPHPECAGMAVREPEDCPPACFVQA